MQDEALRQLKRRHGFDEWCGRNRLREGLFIHNFFPRDGVLPGFRLQRVQQVPTEGEQSHYQSMWREEADPALLVRLDVHSGPSRAAAHELIARLLGGFESPAMQRDETLGIGDVCFSGPGHAAIVFARANLAIFVARVGPKPVAVVELARRFDDYLTDKPPSPAPVRGRAASRTGRSASLRMKVGGKKALPVEVELESAGGGKAFAKIFSSGGEVSLEHGRLVFSAERAGAAHVDAFVIDEGDAVTQRRTTLDVE